MGKVLVMVVIAIAVVMLLLSRADAPHGYEDEKVVHVGGKVLCQDCTHGWNEWMHGKPIKGAKVAVTCLDSRRRAVYHMSDATDDNGEFDLLVSKYVHGKPIKLGEDCTMRLVSSPDPACNVMTDFGGGKCGVKLGHPSVVRCGLLKYTVGPFYFTSPTHDQPETSKHDEDDD